MDPSYFTTPPGQRLQSLSLPSSITAVNSGSSAASSSSSSRANVFTRIATRESSFLSKASSPSSLRRPDESPRDSTIHSSNYATCLRWPKRSLWRWLLVFLAILLCAQLYLSIRDSSDDVLSQLSKDWRSGAHLAGTGKRRTRPGKWLKENSYPNDLRTRRPKAALISLVRNEELDGILQSMRQLEFRWNRRYQYPWVFFNEKPFSDEFKVRTSLHILHTRFERLRCWMRLRFVPIEMEKKISRISKRELIALGGITLLTGTQAATSNATPARTEYHLVPHAHWVTPSHINQTLYHNSLDYLSLTSVGKGHLLSYHAMIRWQSGLFYLHPALAAYEYYWRVEPDVHFFCDVPYDPFRFMQATGMVYGFNMAILDDARSFASLWSTTRDFITAHPQLVHPDASLDWLLDPQTGLTYNNCQFFSNFEIGALSFFRDNEGNRRYFDWLDDKGGFYYSRWGDAPVHTLSVSMFAPPDRVWWFRDIGYQHDIARHCPPQGPSRTASSTTRPRSRPSQTTSISTTSSDGGEDEDKYETHHRGGGGGGGGGGESRFWLPDAESRHCTCEPTLLDENFYKLVPMESPQLKPADTCIRLWLGGEYLRKKAGWSQDAERVLGGDGYGGYVDSGL
ncbi:hypothetical protein AYO20_10455 [Fonsecaea nubica]|uniref:Mannosyltransferase n=1 Tax=Fonsecaea nubica TaxID=856822 RepID=A0A178C9L1_9EURO|nr:hypothetical protein AYO20_10455 [Fonsecaea nubica]OAL25421.1 hypothetical protein AYO20_10455 [Fonsecaea nubica]